MKTRKNGGGFIDDVFTAVSCYFKSRKFKKDRSYVQNYKTRCENRKWTTQTIELLRKNNIGDEDIEHLMKSESPKVELAELLISPNRTRKSSRKSHRKSPRTSPRKSPRTSPRKSPRTSPRKSPRKSPRPQLTTSEEKDWRDLLEKSMLSHDEETVMLCLSKLAPQDPILPLLEKKDVASIEKLSKANDECEMNIQIAIQAEDYALAEALQASLDLSRGKIADIETTDPRLKAVVEHDRKQARESIQSDEELARKLDQENGAKGKYSALEFRAFQQKAVQNRVLDIDSLGDGHCFFRSVYICLVSQNILNRVSQNLGIPFENEDDFVVKIREYIVDSGLFRKSLVHLFKETLDRNKHYDHETIVDNLLEFKEYIAFMYDKPFVGKGDIAQNLKRILGDMGNMSEDKIRKIEVKIRSFANFVWVTPVDYKCMADILGKVRIDLKLDVVKPVAPMEYSICAKYNSGHYHAFVPVEFFPNLTNQENFQRFVPKTQAQIRQYH